MPSLDRKPGDSGQRTAKAVEWIREEGIKMLISRRDNVQRLETHLLSLADLGRKLLVLGIAVWLCLNLDRAHAQEPQMMLRISEIEIHADHLDQYKALLKEEAEASVRLEPGVIAIFPLYQREDHTQIRILEMYADRQAYEAHLKTPHFQKYKTATLHMVKSLKLVDMQAIDAETMTRMFKKMKR
ncbi:putative quinol monooxygenase [Pseudoduganella dura]|nr:antibiotic biosynthesis monooxygenase [Pseudoduganella dura]